MGATSQLGMPGRVRQLDQIAKSVTIWSNCLTRPIGDAGTSLRHSVLFTDFAIWSNCLLCRIMAAKKGTRVIQCTVRECTWFALFLFRVVCVLPLPMLYESKPVFVRSLLLTTKVYVCICKKTSSVFVGHPNLKQCQ